MSWLRIDDGFAEHPKIQVCSERARWLHVTALCYSARNLNDGLLDAKAVKVVCAIVDKPCRTAIKELVAAGLWLELEAGAFQIKDYLEWNPDADTVKRLRKQRQEAGSIGGKNRQANAKANAVADAVTDALAVVRTPSQPLPFKDQTPIGAIGKLGQLLALFDVDGQQKIRRTANKNRCTPGAIGLALEAATHPSAKDPLAVALSTLKRRRAA